MNANPKPNRRAQLRHLEALRDAVQSAKERCARLMREKAPGSLQERAKLDLRAKEAELAKVAAQVKPGHGYERHWSGL